MTLTASGLCGEAGPQFDDLPQWAHAFAFSKMSWISFRVLLGQSILVLGFWKRAETKTMARQISQGNCLVTSIGTSLPTIIGMLIIGVALSQMLEFCPADLRMRQADVDIMFCTPVGPFSSHKLCFPGITGCGDEDDEDAEISDVCPREWKSLDDIDAEATAVGKQLAWQLDTARLEQFVMISAPSASPLLAVMACLFSLARLCPPQGIHSRSKEEKFRKQAAFAAVALGISSLVFFCLPAIACGFVIAMIIPPLASGVYMIASLWHIGVASDSWSPFEGSLSWMSRGGLSPQEYNELMPEPEVLLATDPSDQDENANLVELGEYFAVRHASVALEDSSPQGEAPSFSEIAIWRSAYLASHCESN